MRYYNNPLGSDLTTFKKIISPLFVFQIFKFSKRNFVRKDNTRKQMLSLKDSTRTALLLVQTWYKCSNSHQSSLCNNKLKFKMGREIEE